MFRLLILDDHPIVLAGIHALLSTAVPDGHVVKAQSADEALGMLAAQPADAVITDLELNGGSGLQFIEHVHAAYPHTRIIVYTMHEEVWTVRQTMLAEPDGVVLKSDSPQELLRAVSTVRDGKGYYSPSFCRLLSSLHESPDALSDREREVLIAVAKGLSNQAIADKLVISPATAKTHVGNIMAKLNAHDRAQLVIAAYENGLVRPGEQD